MKRLFHHVTDVVEENGTYRPIRFTPTQIARMQAIRPDFGDAARRATGISLCFYTKAAEVSFAYSTACSNGRANGFDVYENGVMRAMIPISDAESEGEFRYVKETAGETKLEIYLPSNVEMVLWDFQLGEYRIAEQPEETVLFCGDSLTQSLYIPNPSFSFVTLLSRMKDYRYINRGIGSFCYDDSWLDEADPVDPKQIFVLYGANDLVKHDAQNLVVYQDGKAVFCTEDDIPELMEKAEQFLEKLCKIYPQSQIHLITVVYCAAEMDDSRRQTQAAYNVALTELCGRMKLHCIDGDRLIPHIPDCRVSDKIHFNEMGNALVAMELAKQIG